MRSWERGSPPPARKNRVVLSSMIVRVPENETVGDADGAKKEEKSFHPMKSLSPPLRQDRLQSLVDGSGGSDSTGHQKKIDRLPYDSGFNDREWAEHDREGFKVRNNVGRLRDYSPSYRCGGRNGGKPKDILSSYKHRTDESPCKRFRERSPNYVQGRNGRKFRESDCGYGRISNRFQEISFANERDRDGVRFNHSSFPFKLKRNQRRSHFPSPFERRKGGSDYRGHSPPYGNGRDARLFERCFDDLEPEIFSFRKKGDYNNPYISPRSGNGFSKNPLCENMNSRRGTCNNCDDNRYGSSNGRMHGSPYSYGGVFLDNRNSYVEPSPSWRETDSYRSPPPHFRSRHQQKHFPFIRHEGRRLPMVEYHEDVKNRMDSKFYRPLTRDSWIQETNCRSLSPKKVNPTSKNHRRR